MWRSIIVLSALPLLAQSSNFDSVVETTAKRSGLWEASLDSDSLFAGFPDKAKGLLLNIQNRVEMESGEVVVVSRASMAVEWEHRGIQECSETIEIAESSRSSFIHVRDLCGASFQLNARMDGDGESVSGTILSEEKWIPVTFHRLPVQKDEKRPFQGIWSEPRLDRTVVFRISYNVAGLPLVTQDMIRKESSESHFARLGEFWPSEVSDHVLRAMPYRPAFQNDRIDVSVVQGGDGLKMGSCVEQMDSPCPVSYQRASN